MDGKKKKEYIIAGGKTGSERLIKIAKTTWETTRKHILDAGLQKGMKVLDVGCGNGLVTQEMAKIVGKEGEVWGLDFDASIIEIAKNMDTHNTVNFFELDISTQKINETEKFDFIFVRYVLTHLANPDEVVKKLKKALKPEGILYLEDIDMSGYFCHPPNKAFDKYLNLYKQYTSGKGQNPFIGKELYQKLLDNNFKHIGLQSSNKCFHQGIGKEVAYDTFNAIGPMLIKEKLLTQKEFEEVLSELKEFVSKDEVITSFPRMFHCYGKKYV